MATDREEFLSEMGLGDPDFWTRMASKESNSEITPSPKQDEGASGTQSPNTEKTDKNDEEPNGKDGSSEKPQSGSEGEDKTEGDKISWKDVIPETFHRKTMKESLEAWKDSWKEAQKKITTTSTDLAAQKKLTEAMLQAQQQKMQKAVPLVEQPTGEVNYDDLQQNPQQVIELAIQKALRAYEEKRLEADSKKSHTEMVAMFRKDHPDFDEMIPYMAALLRKDEQGNYVHPEFSGYDHPAYLPLVYDKAKEVRKQVTVSSLKDAGLDPELLQTVVSKMADREKQLIEQGKQEKLEELKKKKAASEVLADTASAGPSPDKDKSKENKPKYEPEFQEMLDADTKNSPDKERMIELRKLGVL